MRVATRGLAASDRMTPVSINTRIAPTNGLSTVHHHSVKGARSSRESMRGRLSDRDGPLVAEVGYRGVKEVDNFGDSAQRNQNGGHAPRRRRGIRYAAASRLKHRLLILGRPVKPGDDSRE